LERKKKKGKAVEGRGKEYEGTSKDRGVGRAEARRKKKRSAVGQEIESGWGRKLDNVLGDRREKRVGKWRKSEEKRKGKGKGA